MRMINTLTVGAALLAATGVAEAQSYGFAVYSAFVTASGATALGSGVDLSKKVSTGRYDITFVRDINTCNYNVSLRGSVAGEVRVNNKAGTIDTVTVFTFAPGGSAADRAFGVIVSCAS